MFVDTGQSLTAISMRMSDSDQAHQPGLLIDDITGGTSSSVVQRQTSVDPAPRRVTPLITTTTVLDTSTQPTSALGLRPTQHLQIHRHTSLVFYVALVYS